MRIDHKLQRVQVDSFEISDELAELLRETAKEARAMKAGEDEE